MLVNGRPNRATLMPDLSPDLPNLPRIPDRPDRRTSRACCRRRRLREALRREFLPTISPLLEYQTGERRRPANHMRIKITAGNALETTTPRLDGGVRMFLLPKLAVSVGSRLLPRGPFVVQRIRECCSVKCFLVDERSPVYVVHRSNAAPSRTVCFSWTFPP